MKCREPQGCQSEFTQLLKGFLRLVVVLAAGLTAVRAR